MNLHIIIDIDQTMIDSMSRLEYLRFKDRIRKPDFFNESMDTCIWIRPNLPNFLKFLDKNVKNISIWTNGNREWLNFVTEYIISKIIPKNRFTLLLSIEYSSKVKINNKDFSMEIFIKDINKIINNFPNSNLSLKNTILIDDNFFNCFFNKNNSIPIKKFFILDDEKNSLFGVQQIIQELKKSKNVEDTLKKVYEGIGSYNALFSPQQFF